MLKRVLASVLPGDWTRQDSLALCLAACVTTVGVSFLAYIFVPKNVTGAVAQFSCRPVYGECNTYQLEVELPTAHSLVKVEPSSNGWVITHKSERELGFLFVTGVDFYGGQGGTLKIKENNQK